MKIEFNTDTNKKETMKIPMTLAFFLHTKADCICLYIFFQWRSESFVAVYVVKIKF